MSISAETAKAHANDPAVLCCRAEAGTKLAPSNFEDPAIFPDLIDSGLLKLGQVLNGSTLTKTVDSLTPVTPDIIDKYDELADETEEEADAPAEAENEAVSVTAPAGTKMTVAGGVVKLAIAEGKDIYIEFPVF